MLTYVKKTYFVKNHENTNCFVSRKIKKISPAIYFYQIGAILVLSAIYIA